MRKLTNKAGITVMLLAALAATSVAAIADDDNGARPGAGTAQVTSIQPAAKQAMALLGRERTAVDTISNDLASNIDARPDFGMNPSLSRLAIGNASSSVYVIPADGHVCAALTVGAGGSSSCSPTERVADGKAGPTTVTLENGGIAIYGVVPNGVERIAVGAGRGESVEVGVTNNAYYTVLPAGTPLHQLGYTGPSGPVAFPIYDPAQAFER